MKLIRTNASSGFSLVEVTLSVAIASMAIITFLGLLPLGLETSRKTSISLANSTILEQVVQNLDGMLWGDKNKNIPQTGSKKRLFFNEEGAQVPSGSADMTYLVEVEYKGPASLPKDTGTQTYLQRALVRIAGTNNSSFQFPTSSSGSGVMNGTNYSTFSYLFARTR